MGENEKTLKLQERIDDLSKAFLLLHECNDNKRDYLIDQESLYSGHDIDDEKESTAWSLYHKAIS